MEATFEALRAHTAIGPGGCWEWTRGRIAEGYGWLRPRGSHRGMRAHRVMFEAVYGPIPAGMMVCHSCDNPPCINPEHLFLGSAQANAVDMVAKGRAVDNAGEKHGAAKLTHEYVREIRRAVADGQSQASQADRFDVGASTIHRIVHHQGWSEP